MTGGSAIYPRSEPRRADSDLLRGRRPGVWVGGLPRRENSPGAQPDLDPTCRAGGRPPAVGRLHRLDRPDSGRPAAVSYQGCNQSRLRYSAVVRLLAHRRLRRGRCEGVHAHRRPLSHLSGVLPAHAKRRAPASADCYRRLFADGTFEHRACRRRLPAGCRRRKPRPGARFAGDVHRAARRRPRCPEEYGRLLESPDGSTGRPRPRRAPDVPPVARLLARGYPCRPSAASASDLPSGSPERPR